MFHVEHFFIKDIYLIIIILNMLYFRTLIITSTKSSLSISSYLVLISKFFGLSFLMVFKYILILIRDLIFCLGFNLSSFLNFLIYLQLKLSVLLTFNPFFTTLSKILRLNSSSVFSNAVHVFL